MENSAFGRTHISGTNKVTSRDVVKHVDVTSMTVAPVFNNTGRISDVTRAAMHQAMEELGMSRMSTLGRKLRREHYRLAAAKMKLFNRNSNRPQTGHSAFTLIEILVVAIIIAILAAILFPAFARVRAHARENARRPSRQPNFKQIGLGILQYTQDYDESFLLAVTTNTTTAYGWADTIQPNVKGTQISVPVRRQRLFKRD